MKLFTACPELRRLRFPTVPNHGRATRPRSTFLAAAIMLCAPVAAVSGAAPVTLSQRDEVIPTYQAGPPDPNPMFFFGRASQGAEGRIYPYPLHDNLTNRRADQTYRLVYLENEFVRIGILPEIGGRLFSAVDKTNGYDFVYRQHVIKPALIGLIGAWISGGIEWNIPHHHRATTFLPVQWRTEEQPDGAKTVWVGELELRHRMRWAVGYTLRPGSSVLTCSVRILNRTPLLQSMLCFANVAVHANEHYQIIFPPSTQWVTHHSKREFAAWPIARSRYGGADFGAGVDVSWYKNHSNANSMFAWNYEDDFFAGYDHGRQAGTMCVADHHIVPGKKFWTWGSGPRGRMWDEILTDTDGPYIELMVGGYSDNQPDYSWLQPFETRAFEMSWYPFRGIGGVKQANLDAAVNLEVKDGVAHLGFTTTRAHPAATARLVTSSGQVLGAETVVIDPGRPYSKQLPLPAGIGEHDLRVSLSAGGRELVAWAPPKRASVPAPPAYAPPPAPKDIANPEELVLAGLRADQFHSPTLDADPFWEEALRRDPGNIEAHTGLGRLALRRARFADAERHFRAALARLAANHTTPKNAEPYYYLGVALKAQGLADGAAEALHKATWSQEWKGPAFFALAEIAAGRGDFTQALVFTEHSLDANTRNVRAYGLKAAALRHLGRKKEAGELLAVARRKTDPLDVRLAAEGWLATGEGREAWAAALNEHPANALELAAEYAGAGLWRDGADLLAQVGAAAADQHRVSPLIHYYRGDFAEKLGQPAQAAAHRRTAAAAEPDGVFPFQAENIAILRRAMAANPGDARAPYYLGNLLYDWQPAEAVALWEQAVALDPKLAIAWRNLAQACAHKPGDNARGQAIAFLEKAVALEKVDPTHLAELDQLYQAAGTPVEQRLALLERHQATVLRKDEATASLIALKTFTGRADEAMALLQARTFNVWEGGTRFNAGELWTNAQLAQGRQQLAAKQFPAALAAFEAALRYPASLRANERSSGAAREAEVAYWIGCAHAGIGAGEAARTAWARAASDATAAPAGRRADREGDLRAGQSERYFQALALRRLGLNDRAETILRELLAEATKALAAGDSPRSASANSAESARQRQATAHYLAGLAQAGLGSAAQAREQYTAALAAVPDHLGARLALEER